MQHQNEPKAIVSTYEQVQRFLDDFHFKTTIFNIVFLDYRDKNFTSLLKLEINPLRRQKIIAGLCADDYSDGPLPDTLHHISDMWVFGKKEKKTRDIHQDFDGKTRFGNYLYLFSYC